MIARLSSLLVLVVAFVSSTMAVEMTDNQVAFYLRGVEEKDLIHEVKSMLELLAF